MLLKLLRRLRGSWEYRVLNNSRRMRLILSCWFHGVELVLGRDVRFHHPVRLWGSGGGKIIIEDGVWSCAPCKSCASLKSRLVQKPPLAPVASCLTQMSTTSPLGRGTNPQDV